MRPRDSVVVLDRKRHEAAALRDGGRSLNEIARDLDTSLNNVRRWLVPGVKEKQRAMFAKRYAKRKAEREKHLPLGRKRLRGSYRIAASRHGLGG